MIFLYDFNMLATDCTNLYGYVCSTTCTGVQMCVCVTRIPDSAFSFPRILVETPAATDAIVVTQKREDKKL